MRSSSPSSVIPNGRSRGRNIQTLGNDSAPPNAFEDMARTPRPTGLRPADFTKLIAEEMEKWGKVIKFAGIKPE
jgi:hypothetical protein